MRRRTLQASAVLLVAVGGVFIVLTTSIIGLHDANRAERDANKVVKTANQVQALAQNAQTGVRRYAAAGDRVELLQPLQQAQRELPGKAAELNDLVGDNAEQAMAGRTVVRSIGDYLNDYLPGLVAIARSDPGRARTLAAGESDSRMAAIRDQVKRFTDNQEALVRARQERSDRDARRAQTIGDAGLIAAIMLFVLFGIYMQRLIVTPIREVATAVQRFAAGDLSVRLPPGGSAEVAELSDSFNTMAHSLHHQQHKLSEQSGQLAQQKGELEQTLGQLATEKGRVELFSRLSSRFAAETKLEPLGQLVLDELGNFAEADVGTLYALGAETETELALVATRSLDPAHLPTKLDVGEGATGQAASDRLIVAASLGTAGRRLRSLGQEVVVHHELSVPLIQGDRTIGAIMLGRTSDRPFSAAERQGIEQLADSTAVALANALALRSAKRQARITRAVLETAYDAFVSTNADGTITGWNRRAEAISGWPASEAIGRPLATTIVPERNREALSEGLEHFLATGEGPLLGHTVEFEALHRDGHEFPAEVTISPLKLDGKYSFNAFGRDITARKQAEEQLRESRERFTKAFEEAPIGLAITALDGCLLEVNEPLCEIAGYSEGELLGKNVAEIAHAEDQASNHDNLRGVLADEVRTYEAEKRLTHADGHTIWVRQNSSAIHDAEGRPQYLIDQIQDISGRKQVERQTEMQHAVTHVLSESPTAENAMPRILQMFGVTLGWDAAAFWTMDPETNNLDLSAFWQLPDVDAAEFEAQSRGGAFEWEADLPGRVIRSGRPVWIEDLEAETLPRSRLARSSGFRSAVSLPVSSGAEVLGVLECYSRERQKASAHLIEIMAATGNQIGQFLSRKQTEEAAQQFKDDLLGLVSQELRGPLTSILGYVQLVAEHADDEAREPLDVIDRNAQRILRIVDDLMIAVQAEKGMLSLSFGTVDLAALTAQRVQAAQVVAEEYGTTLKPILGPATTYAGDRERLTQLMDNLITNVIRLTRKEAEIVVRSATDDGRVVFEVTDRGVGIPLSSEEQLFERFTRAASAGQPVIPGVGIGFALVQAIAEAHDGQVSVRSTEGAGTTVRVELPMHRPAEKSANGGPPAAHGT